MIARCSKGTMPVWATSLPGGQAHLYHRQKVCIPSATLSSKRQTFSSYKPLHTGQIGSISSGHSTLDFILFIHGSLYRFSVSRSFILFYTYTLPDSTPLSYRVVFVVRPSRTFAIDVRKIYPSCTSSCCSLTDCEQRH